MNLLSPAQILGEIIGSSDKFTSSFLESTYPVLAAKMGPTLYALTLLFWGVYTMRVYYGHTTLSAWDVSKNMIWTVLGFNILNWGGWANGAYKALTGTIESIASSILGGSEDSHTIIEGLLTSYDPLLSRLGEADIYTLTLAFHYILVLALMCVVTLFAFVNLVLTKFGLALVFLMAPLFVCFAVFPVTRGWFNSWLGKLLNFALIYILSVAVIRFGNIVMATFMENIAEIGRAAQASDLDGLSDALNTGMLAQIYLVPTILIVFLFQVRSWAASLSNSGAVQGIAGTAAGIVMRLKGLKG